ncbi:MAG: hypothetical protein U1E27_01085 [Kiritimatiellia bacterium]|nr:hypothetical protein [Kiritimatiellia bacterium]
MKKTMGPRGCLAMSGLLFVLGSAEVPARTPAADSVRIRVVSRTGKEQAVSSRTVLRGTVEEKESEVTQQITLQRMNPTVPDVVSVEWIVMLETLAGKQFPADFGTKDADLPLARPVEILTPPVSLRGREWNVRRGGSMEDRVVAVAVRVRTSDGTVVAEWYQPKGIEPKVDEWIAEWKRMKSSPEKRQDPRGPRGPDAPPGDRKFPER